MTTTIDTPNQQHDLIATLWHSAALPDWLIVLAQPERVRAILAQSIPEFASGTLVLRACTLGRIRMKKGKWTTLCTLTVEGMEPGITQPIVLQGTLTPPGQGKTPPSAAQTAFGTAEWRWYVPELQLTLEGQPTEVALPSMAALTDGEQARVTLERGLQAANGVYRDLRIQSSQPEILRYKPGSRCTIRYTLSYPVDHKVNAVLPNQIIAKTYKGDTGQEVYAGMRALWASPLSRGDAVRIAEPLAFLPELNVLLQGLVPGRENLKDLIRSALAEGTPTALDALRSSMSKAAVGMAALHTSGALHGETRTWEAAWGEVRDTIEQLAKVNPPLASVAAELLDRLEAFADTWPADALAPTHGSFRPDQVLFHDEGVSFIDFDKFGKAEPAVDLSLFLSATKNIGLSKPHEEESDEQDESLDPQARLALLNELDSLCAGFMDDYAEHAPVSRNRVVLWEALNLLDLVLECWVKVKPARLSNTLLMLERHLRSNALV